MSKTLDALDRLAATHCMGWYWDDRSTGDGRLIPGWCEPDTDRKEFHWSPTTDISQAWECLEKMGLRWNLNLKSPNLVECFLTEFSAMRPMPLKASGSSAPEAIVRACLKAKGVEL